MRVSLYQTMHFDCLQYAYFAIKIVIHLSLAVENYSRANRLSGFLLIMCTIPLHFFSFHKKPYTYCENIFPIIEHFTVL